MIFFLIRSKGERIFNMEESHGKGIAENILRSEARI